VSSEEEIVMAGDADSDSVTSTAASVSVEEVSKCFVVPHHSVSTLKERVLHPFRQSGHERFQALEDLSFEIAAGEFFAVVGRNGSGKSTLLKCLARIYRPDSGSIEIKGRLSPFIELGVGFNPDLNAADNVTVNATLIGLTPREARARFDEIIAFAELEEFLDLKLKNYSSGMQVRLGFATAIQVDADILLVDEVLAVGDALFQEKCFDTFARLKAEGRTIVYVSHDLSTVRRFADRALLLEKGRAVALGPPDPVIAEYEKRNEIRQAERLQHQEDAERFGDRSAEIFDAWLEKEDRTRTSVIRQGEEIRVAFRIRFRRTMENPVIGFNVRDAEYRVVLNVNNVWHGVQVGTVHEGEERTFIARSTNWLAGGKYFITPIVAHSDGQRWADLRDRYLAFDVDAPVGSGAIVDFPQDVEIFDPALRDATDGSVRSTSSA
jgi:ABC-type polysaccharide/polyol phosphate transport system ATPase subunit